MKDITQYPHVNDVLEYFIKEVNLSQKFNLFYQKYRIINESTEEEKKLRLALTSATGNVLEKKGLYLLGIQAPERM